MSSIGVQAGMDMGVVDQIKAKLNGVVLCMEHEGPNGLRYVIDGCPDCNWDTQDWPSTLCRKHGYVDCKRPECGPQAEDFA